MSGDENDTQDMAEFVDGLKRAENRLGVSFVVVAHMGKKESLGARGASVFEDGAETLMTLTEVHGKSYTRELNMLGRDLEETTLGLYLDYPVFKVKNPEATDTPKVEQAMGFIREFLGARPDGELRVNVVREGRARNWSANVMQRALDQLKAQGSVSVEAITDVAGNHKRVKLAAPQGSPSTADVAE